MQASCLTKSDIFEPIFEQKINFDFDFLWGWLQHPSSQIHLYQ